MINMRVPVSILRLRQMPRNSRTAILSTRQQSSFAAPPSPPKLPKVEQEIFEELQRRSTGAFSTPKSSESPSQPTTNSTTAPDTLDTQIKAAGEGEELHPHIRRGATPEFTGEKNPKTGEVGGPKNEPLRWGAGGDYSYNGRVTDF
jgi:hypothetical protein